MNDREILKVAHYYYNLQLTQQQIADRMHMSRPRINRMLKTALATGVVKITVEGYEESNIAIESQLEEKLGLHEAIIAETDDDGLMANLTMRYLQNSLSQSKIKVIGVSYGSTISRICRNLPKIKTEHSVEVIQLAGGFNTPELDLKPDEVANILAGKLGRGAAHSVYAPLFIEDPQLRELFYKENLYTQIQAKYQQVDIAMVAIGCLNETGMVIKDGFVTPDQLKHLRIVNTVGDVALHFIDAQGNIADPQLDQATMGVTAVCYKSIPIRIGIAYGLDKVVPILAAIRGGWINTLISDTQTAQLLLEEVDS